MIGAAYGWLASELKAQKDDDKLLDAMFLRVLARKPTTAERARTEPHDELFRDLFWALLNIKEFLFSR